MPVEATHEQRSGSFIVIRLLLSKYNTHVHKLPGSPSKFGPTIAMSSLQSRTQRFQNLLGGRVPKFGHNNTPLYARYFLGLVHAGCTVFYPSLAEYFPGQWIDVTSQWVMGGHCDQRDDCYEGEEHKDICPSKPSKHSWPAIEYISGRFQRAILAERGGY
jgi:hypothetical protein